MARIEIPRMRVFCKEYFKQIIHKYKFTVSTSKEKVNEAKESDVLVLQTQFRNGFHWIDNVWILNEDSPKELFMELMFGVKQEGQKTTKESS